MTMVRIAASNSNMSLVYTTSQMEPKAGFLISFAYVRQFDEGRARCGFRDWVLDSGAFTARAAGVTLDVDRYIEFCRERLATDATLTEVFALDVIGDWKASIANAELSWKRGVPAIPTFHVGSPWEALDAIARDYPKIALGGAVGYKHRLRWAEQCFARVWPKPIHGFGFGHENVVMALPWHSVDSSSWNAPLRYGVWPKFGRQGRLGLRKVEQIKRFIRVEFETYVDLERRARAKWRNALAQLDYEPRRVA